MTDFQKLISESLALSEKATRGLEMSDRSGILIAWAIQENASCAGSFVLIGGPCAAENAKPQRLGSGENLIQSTPPRSGASPGSGASSAILDMKPGESASSAAATQSTIGNSTDAVCVGSDPEQSRLTNFAQSTHPSMGDASGAPGESWPQDSRPRTHEASIMSFPAQKVGSIGSKTLWCPADHATSLGPLAEFIAHARQSVPALCRALEVSLLVVEAARRVIAKDTLGIHARTIGDALAAFDRLAAAEGEAP